jgi:NADH-quinone oxidoreductase subunit F
LGAEHGYIYIRGEYFYVARILEQAIAEARRCRLAWARTSWAAVSTTTSTCRWVQAPTSVVKKPRLLESLEGKRGNPRIKPPFPAVKGLYGCPPW